MSGIPLNLIRRLPLLLFLLAAVAGLAFLGRDTQPAKAQITITVNTTADDVTATCLPAGAPCSLRGAINRANSTTTGDVTILLPPGLYEITLPVAGEGDGQDYDDVNAGGDFDIELLAPIKVVIAGTGPGPGAVVISGRDKKRVLEVNGLAGGSLTLRNLTLRDGYNNDEGGGCLDLEDGPVTLDNVVVESCLTSDGYNGGGILMSDDVDLTISGTVIVRNNHASSEGGGIYHEGDDLTIMDGATLSVEQNTAVDGDGGGIYNEGGDIILGDDDPATTGPARLIVRGNIATGSGGDGGGIYNDGGAIRRASPDTLAFLSVTHNQAGGDGGGIYNYYGSVGSLAPSAVPITFAAIDSNIAGDDGGGIYNLFGSVFLFGSSIADNRAGGDGGGIWSSSPVSISTLVLVNSTVRDNIAGGDGGGIWTLDDIFNLYNVTISRNVAGDDGGGLWVNGAIAAPPVRSTIDFTTIAFNRATDQGGGVWAGDTTTTAAADVNLIIRASILSNNTAAGAPLPNGPDCFAVIGDGNAVELWYSVVRTPAAANPGCTALAASGTTFNTDPQLQELDNWGSVWPVPVLTHKIPATSPAVDRVPEINLTGLPGPTTSPCSGAPPAPPLTVFVLTDARGATRDPDTGIAQPNAVDGNLDGYRACDAGAFESTPVDIAIAKADSPDPVLRNGLLTYTLTVSTAPNPLVTWATDVRVIDTLPAGVSFVSASATGGGSCSSGVGSTVTCTWKFIPDGSTRTATITVLVTASGGTLVNTATVSQNEADPTPGDHSASATTAVAAVGAPAAPTMVAIWPDSTTTAMITFQPPEGPAGVVTFYRLQSALNFEFNFGVNQVDIPAGSLPFPGNIIQVGLPLVDGWTFYYRLAACNASGCSPFVFVGVLAARQFPAGTTEHWNFVMGAFEFAGTVFAWGQNQVTVAGKNSDFNFWSGVAGFGGVLRASCHTVAPGSSCTKSWASDNPYVSVTQAFPPFGEVGTAVRVH